MKIIIYYIILISTNILYSENITPGAFSITRIQYGGGGDWYSDPSSLYNLLNFVKINTSISIDPIEKRAKIGDDNFNKSSYYYLTGHGNINFNSEEVIILREKLLEGAFLHVDDNYGLDKSFRREIKKVFPEKDWVELPPNHSIFNIYYKFSNGLPKIHKHDNNPPQALGLFNDRRLMVLYTYESDLGDGWEDVKVHDNPEDIRNQALQMGTNIIIYALSNQ